MLRGHLDLVTSSGYIEGWAIDLDAPSFPLLVLVKQADGRKIASGLAHKFREDLAAASMGTGWCMFRLRCKSALKTVSKSTLVLVAERQGVELHRRADIPLLEDSDPPLTDIPALLKSDPTVVHAMDTLVGCEGMFNGFIKRFGVDAFIRATYVYILGRPVDANGLALYGRLIRKSALSPFALLQVLADSDEFRSRPRLLSAPTTPGFPYRFDDNDR